jgi:hypothetical protein
LKLISSNVSASQLQAWRAQIAGVFGTATFFILFQEFQDFTTSDFFGATALS